MLGKRDQSFKFIGKFKYFEVGDLPEEFLIENCSMTVEFVKIRRRNYSRGIFAIYRKN